MLQVAAGRFPCFAPAATLTHAEPAPAASACGAPTGICVTVFVRGVDARDRAVQPVGRPHRPVAVGDVIDADADVDRARDRVGPGSIRQSTPSCGDVTQTAPPPTAMPVRSRCRSGCSCPTRFVRGSIRTTELRPSAKPDALGAPAAIVSAHDGARSATTGPSSDRCERSSGRGRSPTPRRPRPPSAGSPSWDSPRARPSAGAAA